jgi:hypothetical protein
LNPASNGNLPERSLPRVFELACADAHPLGCVEVMESEDREKLELGLTLLQTAATTGNDQAIRRGFKALVETYRYGRPETDTLEGRLVGEAAAPEATIRVERAEAPVEQEER